MAQELSRPDSHSPDYLFALAFSFRPLPDGRVSPKKARPFQRVPVIATAMALSEE
jgi:hypothetical protein